MDGGNPSGSTLSHPGICCKAFREVPGYVEGLRKADPLCTAPSCYGYSVNRPSCDSIAQWSSKWGASPRNKMYRMIHWGVGKTLKLLFLNFSSAWVFFMYKYIYFVMYAL